MKSWDDLVADGAAAMATELIKAEKEKIPGYNAIVLKTHNKWATSTDVGLDFAKKRTDNILGSYIGDVPKINSTTEQNEIHLEYLRRNSLDEILIGKGVSMQLSEVSTDDNNMQIITQSSNTNLNQFPQQLLTSATVERLHEVADNTNLSFQKLYSSYHYDIVELVKSFAVKRFKRHVKYIKDHAAILNEDDDNENLNSSHNRPITGNSNNVGQIPIKPNLLRLYNDRLWADGAGQLYLELATAILKIEHERDSVLETEEFKKVSFDAITGTE